MRLTHCGFFVFSRAVFCWRTTPTPAPERSYRYNVDNRLIDVRNQADTLIASYAYDPFGRRVQKTVGATTTYYLYAEEGMVAELDATGSVTTGYGWKPHGVWGTDPLFIRQGGVVGYYHNDHLGTPQAVISASGVLLWSARYDAFGKATVETAQITNNLRFPGQYFDAETGLHYNYHRYYDPSAGRYTTVDPIGLEGGVNTYVYVAGNTLSRLDPFGLRQMSCPPGTVAPGVACTIDDGSGNARRKPQCALGSPDCLLLDGTSSENVDRKPLRDYDRYGNNMCYSTCMQDEKGAEKQLCRLAKQYPLAKYACKAAEVYSRHTACEERCFPAEDYGCWERY
ncbi:RHS domain-containing protein [Ectothiorhodospiraceae bacterium 2226]|nr:RHS domain-containing protein [Ectothiorhodospiraceae bacterium 2226]